MFNHGVGRKAGLIMVLIVFMVWFHTALTSNKFDDNAQENYQKVEQKSSQFLKLSKQERMRKNFGAVYWRKYDNLENQSIVIENIKNEIIEIGWQINEDFFSDSTETQYIKGSCNSEWNFQIEIGKKFTTIELSI